MFSFFGEMIFLWILPDLIPAGKREEAKPELI
jgi:hypothetical protein